MREDIFLMWHFFFNLETLFNYQIADPSIVEKAIRLSLIRRYVDHYANIVFFDEDFRLFYRTRHFFSHLDDDSVNKLILDFKEKGNSIFLKQPLNTFLVEDKLNFKKLKFLFDIFDKKKIFAMNSPFYYLNSSFFNFLKWNPYYTSIFEFKWKSSYLLFNDYWEDFNFSEIWGPGLFPEKQDPLYWYSNNERQYWWEMVDDTKFFLAKHYNYSADQVLTYCYGGKKAPWA